MDNIDLHPRAGTDCGLQADIAGGQVYHETMPTKTVQATVAALHEHQAIIQRMGSAYYTYIKDICCNPFRQNDWRRRL